MQHDADPKAIERYLKAFSPSKVATELGTELEIPPGGPFYPILYFAVERNSPEIVQVLCDAGAQPNQRMRPLGIGIIRVPLLAYAVFGAEYNLLDTNKAVIALLAKGANPSDIPRDMWGNYLRAPRKGVPDHSVDGEPEDVWCTPELRAALCRNLNLGQRYSLWNAARLQQPNPRMRQFARADNITPLFEVPYHIIGQRLATRQVVDCIRNHAHLKIAKPLVLLFTGPSGHGKTELANRMGDLLSLDLLRVDCTEMKHGTDLLGPKAPYQGSEEGTRLNNYLAKWTGQRAVIFLDEFDKANDDVRASLLLPFESGLYEDRRNHTPLSCSNMIWILAANLGIESINKFWAKYLKDRTPDQQDVAPDHELRTVLHLRVKTAFGAPLTGRLSMIVPFLPFDKGEQAVAAYKFMRELWNERRKPINIQANKLVQHIHMTFVDDGQLATHLAKKGYNIETGARPLENTANGEIGVKLINEYSKEEGEVENKMNDEPLPNYEVRVVTLDDDYEEVRVKRSGSKQTLSVSGRADEGLEYALVHSQ